MITRWLGGARNRWMVVLLAALVPALVKVLCYPHNIGSDDAYIHLQIATNVAHGLGWGINQHEPVNLSSSPLFTIILVLTQLAGSHAIALAQILSCLATIAGLLLLYRATFAETQSVEAALFAEVAAAFSVNLWRWNGALMEATFGFCIVSVILYMFRSTASTSGWRVFCGGLALGAGVLLRPEMGLVVVLAMGVQWLRSTPRHRLRDAALILFGIAVPVVPWFAYAYREFAGKVVPTTFAAKSTGLHLWNALIVQQFAESIVESLLFPTLLILLLLLVVKRRAAGDIVEDKTHQIDPLAWVIPAGWFLGLFSFYYLKTPGLQSTGRYVLPLLSAQAMLLGLLWARMQDRLKGWELRATVAAVALHIVFAIGVNAVIVTPVLQRFESEYAHSMRVAADKMAELLGDSKDRGVFVYEDIGAFSYATAGRFEIYDGGALATPQILGLNLHQCIAKLKPAYVVAMTANNGLLPQETAGLERLWSIRFRQHGIRAQVPYYYIVIYKVVNPNGDQ